MKENKDPITCFNCGTVNPWMNTTCRNCGESLLHQPKPENDDVQNGSNIPDQVDDSAKLNTAEDSDGSAKPLHTSPAPPRPRWNVLWTALGVMIYIGWYQLGNLAIASWVIAPDPRMKALVEKSQVVSAEEFGIEDQKELKSLMLGSSVFLSLVVSLIFVGPFLFGGLIGYIVGGVRESATAMGLAIFVILVQEGQVLLGLVGGVVFAGIGFVGALTANWLRRRLRNSEG